MEKPIWEAVQTPRPRYDMVVMRKKSVALEAGVTGDRRYSKGLRGRCGQHGGRKAAGLSGCCRRNRERQLSARRQECGCKTASEDAQGPRGCLDLENPEWLWVPLSDWETLSDTLRVP